MLDGVGAPTYAAAMTRSRSIVVTGAASGMGAATRRRLEGAGDRVIGVDLRDAEVEVDLGTANGRSTALETIEEISGGVLDGAVTCAGVSGLPDRPGSLLVSVNYFGTVELMGGLRPMLARGDQPSAVAIASNTMTCQPGVPLEVIEACLAGDEAKARTAADEAGSIESYPATKTAVTRWARRHAPTAEWAGSGITLNVVTPGVVETPMVDEARADPLLGEFVDAYPVPLGRHAEADELAGVVTFLLGPDARYLCGSLIYADGGTDAEMRADDWPAPQ